ncbi:MULTISPECIES: DUF4123 domain-containing protein [Photorhabdus]|uniref:DUF4123 domain-containing protein n=1 Tax=Photorhabdus TaxID=29487 RepID=UPI000DCBCBFA|nr:MULTISPECIES: DUF4123 domain-containing protein [Photorhabdus]AXG43710.1 hypothetical protein PluDJC_16590 [Photorhabdus laumondii subsp. laumondii]MCC8390593.1 DUF4123 domain-containing protein [Photorhabdus laumondii]MCZ1248727.1 DUF4123 domain-containing protein [Photorhabdus laumondii subsp. laumondii]NDL18828.1 DUF4123 domain-containing protein [Photorhabdus laumondii subsp. laumondii]NDL50850.1 DUF4123 domain-containing protein [Photorhabdus laumondii subsp. laumondii]
MNHDLITNWIAALKTAATDNDMRYLNMIVDQSGEMFSLIPELQSFSPEIKWCSLFQGLPEEIMADDAPILMRIDLTHPDQWQWMQEVILRLKEERSLLILCSSWSFDLLSQHLIQCVDATWEGQAGILRFFDPSIFAVLFSHVLDTGQQQQLLRPALFWSWLNRDGVSNFLLGEGNAEPVNDAVEKIDLTDKQLENLLCVSDAHRLMFRLNDKNESLEASNEQLFNHCYALMIEATDQSILLDDDRESFVLKHLKSRLSPV